MRKEEKKNLVAIALGGNLGDVPAAFDRACRLLCERGVVILHRSSNYTTEPVDCPDDAPPFTNAALTAYFDGPAPRLLEICKSIEIILGRPGDHGVNSDRTIDIDIILFGDLVLDSPVLSIPHPRASRRRFVLEPLAEIAPDMVFPDSGKSVRGLLSALI